MPPSYWCSFSWQKLYIWRLYHSLLYCHKPKTNLHKWHTTLSEGSNLCGFNWFFHINLISIKQIDWSEPKGKVHTQQLYALVIPELRKMHGKDQHNCGEKLHNMDSHPLHRISYKFMLKNKRALIKLDLQKAICFEELHGSWIVPKILKTLNLVNDESVNCLNHDLS